MSGTVVPDDRPNDNERIERDSNAYGSKPPAFATSKSDGSINSGECGITMFPTHTLEMCNASFYNTIATAYAAGDPNKTRMYIFQGVLQEFYKMIDSNTFREIFPFLFNDQKLKSILNVVTWERISKFADEFLQYHYNQPIGPIPRMFELSDLPQLHANNAKGPLGSFSNLAEPKRVSDDHEHRTNPEAPLPKKRKISASAKDKKQASSKRENGVKAPGTQVLKLPKHRNGERRYLPGEPLDQDVKFGRGGATNHHPGNILYLLEKLKLQGPYTLVATQKGKKVISQELVEIVHHRLKGRFVAREESTGRWYEVDDNVARRKASQTLREDKAPIDQASKRKTLTRKLNEMPPLEILVNDATTKTDQQVSVQDHKAGEILLEFSASAAAKSDGETEAV